MCDIKTITFNYPYSDDITYCRVFNKPAELKNTCPNCSKDPHIAVIMNRYIMRDIFLENCKLTKNIYKKTTPNKEEYISNIFKFNKEQIDEEIYILIDVNINLRKIMSDRLIESERTIYWNEIRIEAPHLDSQIKKNMKDKIKYMNIISDIKSYLFMNYQNYYEIIFKKKTITIKIEKQEECQICFKNYKSRKPFCKICKNADICEPCEKNVRLKYNRCAFCNIDY